jgi:hypothetical protein
MSPFGWNASTTSAGGCALSAEAGVEAGAELAVAGITNAAAATIPAAASIRSCVDLVGVRKRHLF